MLNSFKKFLENTKCIIQFSVQMQYCENKGL